MYFKDIISLEFSRFLEIKRKDFIKILQDSNPKNYEKFCQIKDEILIYNNYN